MSRSPKVLGTFVDRRYRSPGEADRYLEKLMLKRSLELKFRLRGLSPLQVD